MFVAVGVIVGVEVATRVGVGMLVFVGVFVGVVVAQSINIMHFCSGLRVPSGRGSSGSTTGTVGLGGLGSRVFHFERPALPFFPLGIFAAARADRGEVEG